MGARAARLVGREVEMGALRAALDRARDGDLAIVVVEGEAGIGKSRLVAEALAGAGGFTILRGAGDELEHDRPFAPLVSALDLDVASPDADAAAIGALLAHHAPRQVPGLASSVAELRYLVVDGIAELLERRAGDAPVALVLEDLHWADTSTLLAVRAIARRLVGMPALLVLTVRPERAQQPEFERLLGTLGTAEHLHLAPLDDDAVTTLVALLVGGAPGPNLRRLTLGATGNPLFIGELVEALRDEDRLSVDDRTVEAAGTELPQTFPRTVLRRVASLAPETASVLRIAAVLGSRFTIDDLGAVSQRSAADLVASVEEAMLAAVLRSGPEELEFRHDLVRRAIYEDLAPPVRAALHRAAGRALAGRRAPAARVAFHFEAAGGPGDDESVEWLVRAADSAYTNAPDSAADLLERAAAIAGPSHARFPDVETALCNALVTSGRDVAKAEEIARRHLPHARADLCDSLRRSLATALILQGRPDEAVAVLEEAAHAATDDVERARFDVEVALACLMAGDMPRAAVAASRAETTGRAAGDPVSTAVALVVRGRVASTALDFDEAVRLCRRGVEVAATDTSGMAARAHPQFFEGLVLHDADRLDDVARAVELGLMRCKQHGAVWPMPLYHALAAFGRYRAGGLDECETAAEACLVAADESGSDLATMWAHSLLALAALHRGDVGRAQRSIVAAGEARERANSLLGADLMVLADARLKARRGDVDGARELLGIAWSVVTARELWPMQVVLAVDLVGCALATSRADLAREVADALERVAATTGLPAHVGTARWVHGLVAGDVDALVAAVDAYEGSPRLLERAAVGVDAALALHVAGRRDEAVALADSVLARYDTLGAEGDAAIAYRRLRPVLPRSRRAPVVRRPVTGWESLTPTERAVADRVAAGDPNRLVAETLGISPRTVETHLSRVYAKLGVTSRVQLAVEAARHP
jgi:DNA-binding CsgD family transcriptional regulator